MGPAIAHFLATLLRSLLRNLAPSTMRRSLCLSLGACHLLKQTTAFTHLHTGLYPRACGLAVELESPSPPINADRCLLKQTSMASLGAGIPAPIAWTIPLSYARETISNPPHHKKYLTKIPQKFTTKIPHIGKWSRTSNPYTTLCEYFYKRRQLLFKHYSTTSELHS